MVFRGKFMNNKIIKLSIEEQKNFVDSLLNPPEPNDKLKKLAKIYLEIIKNQESTNKHIKTI